MATLQNAQIDQSFGALLKTDDNGNITATPKAITDGAGNATNMEMSNTETKFPSGTVDFTGATVIGAGGAAGLESGTGADSMQSAASLTTNPAAATGDQSIALGENASAGGAAGIAIGKNATQGSFDGVVVGPDASSASNGTAIGPFATTTGNQGMAIGHVANAVGNGTAVGRRTDATGGNSFAGGNEAQATGLSSIAIGNAAAASGAESMAYGEEALANATSAAAFGQYAEATSTYAIAFGRTSAASGDGSVAFGQQSQAAQAGAVAMGRQVTSDTADTTHVRALKIVAPDGAALGGNGITLISPDGTEGVVTLLDSDELALDGVAIGGGGGGVTAFKTPYVSETQATSSCDTVRSTVLIPANTFAAGDVVMMRSMQTTANQTGFTYSTIWITTNGSIGDAQGGQNLSQIQSSADGKGFYEKTLFIQTADGTGLGTSCYAAAESVESSTSGVVGGDPIMDLAIDWTINQYMTVSVCIDNSGATWTNYGAILTKLN